MSPENECATSERTFLAVDGAVANVMTERHTRQRRAEADFCEDDRLTDAANYARSRRRF